MRALVISDIHANFAAFEAILKDAQTRMLGYDLVWCLGDMVGYGPDPNECIDLLLTLPHVCLSGNHDWAALGKLDLQTFHAQAARIAEWTRESLTPRNKQFLLARPEKLSLGEYLMVHASPRQPIWEYITDTTIAEENFEFFEQPFCLCGHTHVAALFVRDEKSGLARLSLPAPGVAINLKKDSRYIINPGGVGQPRDGDPRAAYAILDTDARLFTLYRAEYDYQRTQAKMRELNFPQRMIDRLAFGR
jgi:diadenosine tetraphosphatase ApaH/serine/threonine PP2A family protein phosphatase